MTDAKEKAIVDMLITVIDNVDPPMIMYGIEKEVTTNAIKYYSNKLIAILGEQQRDIILSGATKDFVRKALQVYGDSLIMEGV